MQTSMIISIWLVDPVAGTFVDWPENLDLALAGSEQLWKENLSLFTDHNLLFEIGNTSPPGAWHSEAQLAGLLDQCEQRLATLPTTGTVSAIRKCVNNILLAVQHAQAIPDAGVYIG